MPPQQRTYVSTDPNFGASDRGADRVYVSTDPNWSPTTDKKEAPSRSAAADVGIGAAKGLGRTLLDLSSVAAKINPVDAIANLVLPESVSRHMPGRTLERAIAANRSVFDAENTAQTIGGLGAEALTTAVPGALATRGSQLVTRPLRNVAVAIERHAVPAFTKKEATNALTRGAGIVRERSGEVLQKEAAKTPFISSTVVQRGGRWVPKSKGPSPLQSTADKMTEAAAQKAAGVSPGELAWTLGGGGIFGLPGVLAGGAKMLARPLPSSIGAQALFSSAPAVQAAGGGGGALALQAMLRLLGGGD